MYTKGKWEVDDILIMSDNTCVARVFKTYYPEESQEANAHLIAAAPNMHGQLATGIESLEEVREIVVEVAKTCSPEIAEQMVAMQSYISGVIAGNEMALAQAEGN